MFASRLADEGCLTQNQLFSSISFSLQIKGSQLGVLSGKDATCLGQDTYGKSEQKFNKLEEWHKPYGRHPFWIMPLGQKVSTLIFKIR
jgi:hypothetical protein